MKVTIIAVGSRGDVQPLAALGVGLKQRGHQVRLAAGDEFADLVSGASLDFVPLGIQMHRTIAQYKDFYQLVAAIRKNVIAAAGSGQDAYISDFMGIAACTYARGLSVPYFYAGLIPGLPTRAFAHPLFKPRSWGGWYNLRTYRMADTMALRNCPDASCLLREPRPTYLYGFSEHVVPRPPEWEDYAHITGYWFLDRAAGYQPPAALEAFLQKGPPPIVAGFGSAETGQGRRTADLVMAALAQTGQRGVFLTGWGNMLINDPPSNVYVTDAVPYDWLFPRAAAVIHHGGAGTIASALRAGVPSVVVPFGLDQVFWGRRIQELGAGPQPIARKSLTVEKLASAIRLAVEDPNYRARAAALGEKIRAEDGVSRAVEIIEAGVAEYKPAALGA
ncbi:MAG: glycosyltransferase [Chloroflexi bacterium]|nr:glycosyltransferase [Chloroflexota bacterium]